MRRLAVTSLLVPLLLAVGCGNDNAQYMTDDRLSEGMVMILPGIEGVSQLNKNIRQGLVASGCPYAMPIRSWGHVIPVLGMLMNQVDIIGAHLTAGSIRDELIRYQDNHPGKPVYLIGHSGGGGIAVLVAEKMPPDRKLSGLILLSASISSAHNMTDALSGCENGIVNFYNPTDGFFLGVGTTLVGNIDRLYGPAAGLIGFDLPANHHNDTRKQAYLKLYQVELTPAMTLGDDAHTVSTRPMFVASYVSPWVLRRLWPAGPATRYAPVPEADFHSAR
ncbi:MAG: serine aminopeptidase domain-containing protein [Planctomycetota bacterium]